MDDEDVKGSNLFLTKLFLKRNRDALKISATLGRYSWEGGKISTGEKKY